MNSSKAPNYFNNEDGKIKKLKKNARRPHNMSAISGERQFQLGLLTMVRIYTDMTEAEISDFSMSVAINWLTDHLTATGSEDFVEGDVYNLLANPLVRGWWKNEWNKRDKEIVQEMAIGYRKIMEEEDSIIGLRKAIIRRRLKAQYESMHQLCCLPKSPDYVTLENSYAILWKLIGK